MSVTVTLLDGLVLARSAFHHSMNYRSVVALGTAREVTDPAREARRARRDRRARDARAHGRRPAAVAERAQGHARPVPAPGRGRRRRCAAGPPLDDEEDYALPCWAGVLPLRLEPLGARGRSAAGGRHRAAGRGPVVSPPAIDSRRVSAGAPEILFTGFPGFIGARLLPRLLRAVPATGASAAWCRTASWPRREDGDRGDRARAPAHAGPPGRWWSATSRARTSASNRRRRARWPRRWKARSTWPRSTTSRSPARPASASTWTARATCCGCCRTRRGWSACTTSPPPTSPGGATGVFRETDLDVGQSFKNHYEETKFLAEVDVVKSGVPATDLPARASWWATRGRARRRSSTGRISSSRRWSGCPRRACSRASARARTRWTWRPVDFVVEGLARLATVEASRGRTYHLTDPAPLTVGADRAPARGGARQALRLRARARAASPGRPSRPASVQRFFGMPVQALDYFDHPCRHDCAQAQRDLDPMGVRCPPFASYVDRLVKFYLDEEGRGAPDRDGLARGAARSTAAREGGFGGEREGYRGRNGRRPERSPRDEGCGGFGFFFLSVPRPRAPPGPRSWRPARRRRRRVRACRRRAGAPAPRGR